MNRNLDLVVLQLNITFLCIQIYPFSKNLQDIKIIKGLTVHINFLIIAVFRRHEQTVHIQT